MDFKELQKKVWFIRHAQSMANADKNFRTNYTSASLVPLSKFGFKQSEDIVKYFKEPPGLIITSPYLRTKQTAQFLIEKYPDVPKEEWQIQEFTYLSSQKCFNTTFNERRVLVDEYWNNADPFYRDDGGAESFTNFFARISQAINKLKLRKEEFIVLFCHEYVILAAKYMLEKKNIKTTDKEMKEFRKYCLLNKIQNTGKIEINYKLLESIW